MPLSRLTRLSLIASLVASAAPLDALAQQTADVRCATDPRLLPAAVRAASATDEERPQITADSLRSIAEASGLAAPSLRLWIGRGSDEALTHEINRWVRLQALDPRVCRVATAAAGRVRAVVIAPRTAEFTADVRRDDRTASTHASFTARLSVATREAHVVLSAPNGRSFVAELERAYVLPSPGTWVAQLVANTDEGPIPWARRTIVVEGASAASATEAFAPRPIRDTRTWLVELNRARVNAGSTALRQDPILQSIADARASTRARLSAVAHTLSEDDAPDAHLQRERVRAERVAENVARAATLDEAFARLDRSPSHRRARMDRSFDAVAIAAVHAADGWYVVELFALRPALSQ